MSGARRLLMASGSSEPVVVFDDTFTEGSNTQLTAHTPDTAPAGSWTDELGSIQVLGSTSPSRCQADAISSTHLSAKWALCVFDIGEADGTIDLKVFDLMSANSTNGGIIFRYSDTNNFWRWIHAVNGSGTESFYLQKIIAGSYNTIVSVDGSGMSDGDTLSVELSGNSIEVFHNDTSKGSTTDSALSTATKHGICAVGGTSTTLTAIDNMLFERLTMTS